MRPAIYDQAPMARLADLAKSCELAMDLISNDMLLPAGDFLQDTGLAPEEFAVGNWIVRPRFPEDNRSALSPLVARPLTPSA